MASVGDSKVPQKTGKILKTEAEWKTYFGSSECFFSVSVSALLQPCVTPSEALL